MLGEVREDYVIISSDLVELKNCIESGLLTPDAEERSIPKVLVVTDRGVASQMGEEDDEYNETDLLGRLDDLNNEYGFECLEKAIFAFERVVLHLNMEDVGRLTLFQVLCICLMHQNERYAFTRCDLAELKPFESSELSFMLEFGDVIRAVHYCTVVKGSEGLVCKTLKVSNSRGAIGAAGDYLGGISNVQRDAFADQAGDAQEILALRGKIDSLSVDLQDSEQRLSEMAEGLEEERRQSTHFQTELEKSKASVLSLSAEKTDLEKQVANLTEQLSSPIGEASIKDYTTITTQSVSTCSVGHVLYFKELSYVFGLGSTLNVFMNKLSKSNRRYKMLIFDDDVYLEGKYGEEVPVVTFKDYAQDKMRYMQSPITVISSRIISPIEDYLQLDVDVLIIYDRLRTRTDMVSGGIVSRFVVASSSHDVDRARKQFGVTDLSEIICSAYSSATVVNSYNVLGLGVNERLVATMRQDHGVGRQSAARATQISCTQLAGRKQENLIDIFRKKCGDIVLL